MSRAKEILGLEEQFSNKIRELKKMIAKADATIVALNVSENPNIDRKDVEKAIDLILKVL